MAAHYDVEDYGAIPDWNGGRKGTILPASQDTLAVNPAAGLRVGQKIAIEGVIGTKEITAINGTTVTIKPAGTPVTNAAVHTDNYDPFVKALVAMLADRNAVRKLIAKGWFYIGQTLTIAQTVHFEGVGDARATIQSAGVNSRSSPGTWLLFPKNIDGIRIKSALTGDVGGQAQSAERTKLKDFTISCIDSTTASGHGIYSTATFDAECVTVEDFGGNGFHLYGQAGDKSGIADLSSLWNCFAKNNNDGFHLEGSEANACRVLLCNAFNNRAVGFYDNTGDGGTGYAFCHATTNRKYNYQTKQGIPTFFHCYNEGGDNCSLEGSPSVIGGNLTALASKDGSTPFEIVGGVASKLPFEYWNQRGARSVRSRLGELVTGKGMSFLSLDVLGAGRDGNIYDHSELRYGGDANPWLIWTNDNTAYREYMRFPTVIAKARAPAPWFIHGIYLGSPIDTAAIGGSAQVRFTASPGLPSVQRDANPLTYEVGDTVWEATPSAGARFARRCVAAGTLSTTAPASMPKGAVNTPGTLVVSSATGLAFGQYISVAGLDGGATKKITAISGSNVTYKPTGGTVGVGAAISFVTPAFETLYGANGPTVTTAVNITITTDQRFVTVTASGKTVTLPVAPFDGETHEIKGNGTFTVTIAGNGANIDGAASYTQSTNRSNTRVRFNSTSGEWEIR
ncbi:hypothetical protein ACFVH9_07515 [Streptomyces hirsutus]|uniref:hypothetical protein n=1 Tax=Streptomyces hirsutus TaxID=35620 RepID=UPI0036409458